MTGPESKTAIAKASGGKGGDNKAEGSNSAAQVCEGGDNGADSEAVTKAEETEHEDSDGVEYVLDDGTGDGGDDVAKADSEGIEELPLTIETGDSIKVKQVLDDSTILYVTEGLGYEPDYTSDNWKLGLMFLACLFALGAQFCPIPFPESRLIVGACCACYFLLSGIVQYIISFIDCERVLSTRAGKAYVGGVVVTRKDPLTFCTKFDRFQEWFNFVIYRTGDKGEGREENPNRTIGEMYVGKYFTATGEFDEERWRGDVLTHILRFEAGKYGVFKYDHKSD
jgi:signal peptidase complex subunit 2